MPDTTPVAILDAALAYAERGWPVFPLHSIAPDGRCTCGAIACGSAGKHPRTLHGVDDAGTDPDQILAWWREWPGSNIGIATGAAGLTVLDVDQKGGGLEQLGTLNLPNTLTARTGGGGLHFYFSGAIKAHDLMPGVHIKSLGGYVVAPPSHHRSGNCYEWIDETRAISPLPPQFANGRVTETPATPASSIISPNQKEWVTELLTQACPEGQRDNTLTRLAGYFRNLLPEMVTHTLLQEWNRDHCEPPLSWSQITTNVHHKYSRYADLVGALDLPAEDGTARYVLHAITEAFTDDEPIPWIVEPLFSLGSLSLLFGKAGSKKTYLCQDLAIHVSLGLEWLGHQVNAGAVLMIDEESGPRRMKRRWREVLRAHGSPTDLPVRYTSLARFTLGGTNGDLTALDELLTTVRPVMVIADALVDITGGADENDAKQMHSVMQDLRFLADRHSTAIIVIHHSGKGGTYRGSSAIMGAVDLALEVVSDADSPILNARAEKTRDTEPFNFASNFVYNQLAQTVDFGAAVATQEAPHYCRSETYVLRYLVEHGPSAITEIESHADVCTATAARRAVFTLAERKIIQRVDGGKQGEQATYRTAV